jgi:AraC-like DNA-binding protein
MSRTEISSCATHSRAAFARRFNELTTQPPLSYLTWWRMTLAGRLLRSGDQPLRAIAAQAGYGNEYAFSKAFKRELGIAPSRYRAEAQSSEP